MLLRAMKMLAKWTAIIGGITLVVLVVLTCISVIGRGASTLGHSDFLTGLAPGLAQSIVNTGVGPVTGDFELLEAGVAFAVFAFLPLCQLHSGHATVDVFTSLMPEKFNRFLIAFWEVLLAILIVVISWRLFVGMEDKMRYGETTFLLQFPIWWSYLASFLASVVAAIVAIYCAYARVMTALTGKSYMPASEGALH